MQLDEAAVTASTNTAATAVQERIRRVRGCRTTTDDRLHAHCGETAAMLRVFRSCGIQIDTTTRIMQLDEAAVTASTNTATTAMQERIRRVRGCCTSIDA